MSLTMPGSGGSCTVAGPTRHYALASLQSTGSITEHVEGEILLSCATRLPALCSRTADRADGVRHEEGCRISKRVGRTLDADYEKRGQCPIPCGDGSVRPGGGWGARSRGLAEFISRRPAREQLGRFSQPSYGCDNAASGTRVHRGRLNADYQVRGCTASPKYTGGSYLPGRGHACIRGRTGTPLAHDLIDHRRTRSLGSNPRALPGCRRKDPESRRRVRQGDSSAMERSLLRCTTMMMAWITTTMA